MKGLASLLAVLVLGLAGCSPVFVRYDFDKDADFRRFKTYRWTEQEMPNDELAQNPLLKERVQTAVDRVLGAKGYVKNPPDEPDFLVAAYQTVQQRIRIQDWGYAGWYRPWWGPYGGRVELRYYDEGTLIVDVIDASRDRLVWRGTGTGIVRQYKNPEKMQEHIEKIVSKVLAHFPPGT